MEKKTEAEEYFVVKRSGKHERIQFDKVTNRLKKLCYGLRSVDSVKVSLKVFSGIFSGIRTIELDNLAAEICSIMGTEHPDYQTLAGRIFVSNLHKETIKKFSEVTFRLHDARLVNDRVYNVVKDHAEELDSMIIYDRDYNFSYFGLKTLEKSYLIKIGDKIMERPQHLLMRVAVGLWSDDLERVRETYQAMSKHYFIKATPILFNIGTMREGLASCYLISMKGCDSVEGIYDILKEAALISKSTGGIGIACSNIRAEDSKIHSNGGSAGGLKPMLRVFDRMARHISQSRQRNGSIAFYLEPWHADILSFLELKLNSGAEENRARDLFYALWIPNLFMKRVKEDSVWSLFCPNECPGLQEIHSEEFEKLYIEYESAGKFRKQMQAQELFNIIMDTQNKTGGPFILFKDHVNQKNNLDHLGTIVSSNLCTEIVLPTSEDSTAVCNLGSIGLPSHVRTISKNGQQHNEFDFDLLGVNVCILTRNLNKIIDITEYPSEKAKKSNLSIRPLGLGVSGLADTFFKLHIPFDSEEAKKLNKEIFECIYFHALKTSNEIAKEVGPFPEFSGSQFSKGKLQFDLWSTFSGHSDKLNLPWDQLKEDIKLYGTRNSHLTTVMPTKSTAQILGNSECIEVINSNVYKRQTKAGEFEMVNKYLLKDLIELNIYSDSIKNQIVANRGSIANIKEIPDTLKKLYKTVWEISQKVLLNLSADRGPYIDHSQSMNIFMAEPTHSKLAQCHFHAWDLGLKTGQYYLYQRPLAPIQITVSQESVDESNLEPIVCNLDAGCLSCSG